LFFFLFLRQSEQTLFTELFFLVTSLLILDLINMSNLLTQIVRRQTLTIVQRRSESVLLQPGPPLNKLSAGVKEISFEFDRKDSKFCFTRKKPLVWAYL